MHDLISELKPLIVGVMLPPALNWLLCAGSALWFWRRPGRWAGAVFCSSLLLGWLACTEGVGYWLWRELLQAPPAQNLSALRERVGPNTAILVLGGGIHQDNPAYGHADLKQETLERLRYGVWLGKQLRLPVGFTGGRQFKPEPDDISEAEAAARFAREELSRPLKWLDDQARDTVENARLSIPLLERDGVQTIVLVTSAPHMPRALRAFKAQGAAVRIIAAPIGWKASGPFNWTDWMPSSEGVRSVRYACYEALGLLAGR